MTAITNEGAGLYRPFSLNRSKGNDMKQSVIVNKGCISSVYGEINASDKPQEFDADFAAHLIEIGNAELHGDPVTGKVAKAAGLETKAKPGKKDSAAKPASKKSKAKDK